MDVGDAAVRCPWARTPPTAERPFVTSGPRPPTDAGGHTARRRVVSCLRADRTMRIAVAIPALGSPVLTTVLRFTPIGTTGFITDGPRCVCGARDWFPKGDDQWKCSKCSRTRRAKHRGFIVNGPECVCENRDWFIGESGARCSVCDRFRETAGMHGYIIGGPACVCENRDWFVGESIYRCSVCDRTR
jgi:hypothetical protein